MPLHHIIMWIHLNSPLVFQDTSAKPRDQIKTRKACPKWTRSQVWPVNTVKTSVKTKLLSPCSGQQGAYSGGHFFAMPKSCFALVPATSVVIRKAGLVYMRAARHVWSSWLETCHFTKEFILGAACSIDTWLAFWLCNSQIAKTPFSVYKIWWINHPLGFGRTY